MTTIQENMTSPFIQQLAVNIFGSQPQYINDLLKIKKLMNKTKLGILSEQLFLILTLKYPQEYSFLLMEQNNPQEITTIEEDEKDEKKNIPVIKPEKIEKENEQSIYQNWIKLYGRP